MNVKLASVQSRLDGLGLCFLSAGLESFLAQPRTDDMTTLDLVSELVDLEVLPRKERSARSRIKLSGMPSIKRLEDFDMGWLKGGLTQRKFDELASLQFIERKENVVLLGASGLGKTHLMLGLAHRACAQGYTAYYTTCTDLMESLVRAKEQNRLKRRLTWLRKPHVLVVDEVGYEPLTPEQANLFFQVVNARYEAGSLILTTNKAFGAWAETMRDEAIASATLDRLLHHAHALVLKGDSYRMKDRIRNGVVDSE
jgi:DNA replication protein DnaC